MRWLALSVLAACSSTTSRAGFDAAIDGKQFHDARIDASPAVDAYAARACDAPPTFADPYTPSRVLHVVPGAAGFADGSVAHPFGSIATAAAAATPGTFIRLAPGNHAPNQLVANLTGAPDAPIWIGGEWGTMPKIGSGSEAIHLTNPHYVVIQNLEVSAQSSNGINIDDGVAFSGSAGPVAIVNVNVHDEAAGSEASCIKVAGVNSLYVYNSLLRRCTYGVNAIGVHGGAVARNTLDEIYNTGVRFRGGSTDVDVRQNLIDNAGVTAISLGGFTPQAWFRPPLSTTAPNAEARRLRAFNNGITGTMTAAITFDDCVDCLVAHNLVYGNESRVLRILQNQTTNGTYTFEPMTTGRVINNSFSWSITMLMAHVEVGVGVDASAFTFSNNLWNNIEVPGSSRPTLPATETGQVFGQGTGYFPSQLTVYCGGPEAGAAAPLPEVDGTFDGFCRSQGDAPTIGPLMVTFGACDL